MITKFIQRLRLQLISNKEKKIVLKFIRSLREVSWDRSIIGHVNGSYDRSPLAVEHYSIESNQPSWIRNSKCFDPEYTYDLADVVVSSATGVVWLPDGRIIGESYGSLSRLLRIKKFQLDYFTAFKELEGKYVPLAATDGFFHFVFESLPAALACLEKDSESRLLIAAESPAYVYLFAKLISEAAPITVTGPVRVSNVIISGKTPYSGFVQKRELERIRSFFFNKISLVTGKAKIYISRLNNRRRKLENESELEQKLVAIGFQRYFLQDMSVIEQINLFQGAGIVVAPHGAGLSNLIWCNKGVKVIEIFPFKPRNDCYARLAINLELDYKYVVSEESKSSSGRIPVNEVVDLAIISQQSSEV